MLALQSWEGIINLLRSDRTSGNLIKLSFNYCQCLIALISAALGEDAVRLDAWQDRRACTTRCWSECSFVSLFWTCQHCQKCWTRTLSSKISVVEELSCFPCVEGACGHVSVPAIAEPISDRNFHKTLFFEELEKKLFSDRFLSMSWQVQHLNCMRWRSEPSSVENWMAGSAL